MNKFITRVAKLVLGLSLAAGVGVAVGSQKAGRVDAAVEEHEHSFTSNTLPTGWTNSGMTFNSSYYKADAGNYVQLSASSMFDSGNVLSSSVSVDIACGTFGTWSGNKTATFTVSFLNSSGTVLTTATGTTGTLNSTAGTYRFSSSPISLSAPSNVSAIDSLRVTVTTLTSTSTGCLRFAKVKLTYSQTTAGAATISSISVSGSMSKTTYSTVDSWSNAGFTATATLSDSTSRDVTSSATWSYSPSTPSNAVIANSNEEVNGLSVTATATEDGKSGSKATTGVSVSYATVAQGLAAIPTANDEVDGVIVQGTISYIDSIDTSTYHNATYCISDDGTRTSELTIYRGKGLNNADFTNSNDIKVGDVVLVYGNLKYYNGTTKEFLSGNYLLNLDRPASSDPSITITEANFTIKVGDADVTLHETHENVPEGGSIKWISTNTSAATIGQSTGVLHAVGSGSTTITAQIVDSGDNVVASNSISVTVEVCPVSVGDTIIIYAEYNSTNYYLSGVENNLGTCTTTQTEAMVLTVESGNQNGTFALKNGSNYLKAINDNKLETESSLTDNSSWTILDDGSHDIITNYVQSDRWIQYNHNNGSNRFACYKTSQTGIHISQIVAPEVDEVTVAGDTTADAQGELSITKQFLYDVTYVDSSNPGNESVTVTVLNSSDTTDGASVTTAPSNGTFSVTFTSSDTYTVTVTSVEDDSISDSMTITVSNIYVAVLEDYDLYSGTSVSGSVKLTEGDYVIYYDGYALNNVITSDRAQYEEVTPTNDKISTADTSIIWHIAPSGDYFTIYNAASNKYLASTGAKNKAQLLSDGTDNKSLWSVSITSGTFEFVNKQNTTNSVNANLRNNGTYGFACYATSTGGALSLYKKAYSASDYAKLFNKNIGCDSTGNTAPLAANWALVYALYGETKSSERSQLTGGTASEASQNVVEQALAKYDYILAKYGTSTYNNFLSRSITPLNGGAKVLLANVIGENTNKVAIIVVISMVSVTAIGGYFFLKKRREQN